MSPFQPSAHAAEPESAWTSRALSPPMMSSRDMSSLDRGPFWRRGVIAAHLLILLAATAVLVLAAMLHIRQESQVWLFDYKLPETCAWRRIYGIDCLGCGLTRSFVSLAHVQPLRAWHFNPAGLVLFAGLLFQYPYRLAQLWRIRCGKPALSPPLYLYLGWVVLALVVLLTQWIFRTGWPLLVGG